MTNTTNTQHTVRDTSDRDPNHGPTNEPGLTSREYREMRESEKDLEWDLWYLRND